MTPSDRTAPLPPRTGATTGPVQMILRLEALAVLACATTLYAAQHGTWTLFAILFLVPDLSMLGYLVNRSVGAVLYNAGHSYLSPALLMLWGYAGGPTIAPLLALIWIAHIGFDRMLGYGLKYATGFGDTHLAYAGSRP